MGLFPILAEGIVPKRAHCVELALFLPQTNRASCLLLYLFLGSLCEKLFRESFTSLPHSQHYYLRLRLIFYALTPFAQFILKINFISKRFSRTPTQKKSILCRITKKLLRAKSPPFCNKIKLLGNRQRDRFFCRAKQKENFFTAKNTHSHSRRRFTPRARTTHSRQESAAR